MENPLDPVTVGDRLATRPALKLASPLRGLKLLPCSSVASIFVKLGVIVCVTLSVPLPDGALSFFERSAFLLEIADVLVCQAVVSGHSVGHERHVAGLVAFKRDRVIPFFGFGRVPFMSVVTSAECPFEHCWFVHAWLLSASAI